MKKKPRYAIDEKEIIDGHFSQLVRLLTEESKADRDRYKEEVLNRKPEDRQKRGKALLHLDLYGMHYSPTGGRLLTFGNASGRPLHAYSLNVGDVVRLSGVETPQSERPTGTVYERTRLKITVFFSVRLPTWIGRDKFYNLTQAENLTTYDRMFNAIKEVGRAKHDVMAWLRDISLGLKKPRFGDPLPEKKAKLFNKNLNELQEKAVFKALEAEDLLLVHGPPGTGKTSVLVEIIQQAWSKQSSVLVTAPSNAACDYLVERLLAVGVPVTRLGHPARMTEKIREHTLNYKIINHPFSKMIDKNEARLSQLSRQRDRRQDRRVMTWDEKKEMRDEVKSLRNDNRSLKAEIFKQVWNIADVVVATHTVSGDNILRGREFDWVIVDEATQATEPSSWIPISRAGKLVMAGDHCQLPPTVFTHKTGRNSLQFTLFERYHEKVGDEGKIRLEVQYRMNEKIMNFSSNEFYDGKLIADDSVKNHTLEDLPQVKTKKLEGGPVIFLDTAGLGYEEKKDAGSFSPYNEEEASLVIKEYQKILKAGISKNEIAIISPYSAQVKLLADRILGTNAALENLEGPEVDSIDAFQGREKEVVIVSLVRSNLTGSLGFLSDTRRMNVAMTRARRKLIVVGDSATISNLPFYEHFIAYVESIKGYTSAWEYVS